MALKFEMPEWFDEEQFTIYLREWNLVEGCVIEQEYSWPDLLKYRAYFETPRKVYCMRLSDGIKYSMIKSELEALAIIRGYDL